MRQDFFQLGCAYGGLEQAMSVIQRRSPQRRTLPKSIRSSLDHTFVYWIPDDRITGVTGRCMPTNILYKWALSPLFVASRVAVTDFTSTAYTIGAICVIPIQPSAQGFRGSILLTLRILHCYDRKRKVWPVC